MKYVLSIFGVLVLLVLVILLIFRSGPEPASESVQNGEKVVSLGEYEQKAAVASLTTRGKIVADENRRAIRISVTRNERVLEILEGYEENVLSRHTFPNNDDAYKIFLSALDTAGFSREQETDIKDERGICPLGRRYVYRLQDGPEQVLRSWSTSCSTKQGSFGGNARTIRSLFERQIPEYRQLTRSVKL